MGVKLKIKTREGCEDKMVLFAVVLTISIFIICVTILIKEYIRYCGMCDIWTFSNPKCAKRITELEKQMEELKKE